MSAERSSNSHAVAWMLSLLAVPVLYLLSVPWVMLIQFKGAPLLGGMSRPYCAPFDWLHDRTPLRAPLEAYWNWCARITGMQPP